MSSHKVIKTIAEINERIKKGRAVVLNAEEMTEAVRRMGPEKAAREVDVVTTGTFMVRGDLKGMKPRYLRGLSLTGYGVSLSAGVGIPIPILNEEMAAFTGVSNEDILMPVKDYGYDYPNGLPRVIQHVRFSDLLSGEVEIQGRKIPTVPLTSHVISLEIADTLKAWIEKGEFLLTEAVDRIPAY